MSGDYVIEEVLGDSGITYRRLVFLTNQNIIQSETRLKTGKVYVLGYHCVVFVFTKLFIILIS